MKVTAILEKLDGLGVKVSVTGDTLRLEPGSQVPDALLVELKAHKQEVILVLSEHSPIQSKPRVVEGPKEWQAEQVAQCVEKEGVCIFWSQLFGEAVAFIKDESYRSNVPGDIVTYTSQEIRKLFPHNGGCPSNETLWLIHEAKKLGGHVIEG